MELVQATFGPPDSAWAPGKHGTEYNLPGENGGLDWIRLVEEHDAVVTPENRTRGEIRAEEIKMQFRKRR